MKSLLYCLMVLVSISNFGGVFSGPVQKVKEEVQLEPWENPCGGSNPTPEQDLDLQAARTAPGPVNFTSLVFSLETLISKSQEYKEKMIGLIRGKDAITQLGSQSGFSNFPTERSYGSGLLTNTTTLLTEDYRRLSKLFIFVEKGKNNRDDMVEQDEKNCLEKLENKCLESLCKIYASGISFTPGITRDILNRYPTPSDVSEKNEFDYIMIRDMVKVLESIKNEYKTLIKFRK